MNQKGQIGLIPLVGIGVSIFLATIGGYAAQSVRTDDKIIKANEELNETQERVATLEEAIATIKSDNAEVKKDIKLILQKLK